VSTGRPRIAIDVTPLIGARSGIGVAVAEILHALRTTLAARTALIASHRISAIRDASWIVVLEAGRIVEQGKHDELLAAGGRYWALLNRQQLEDAIEEDAENAEIELAQPMTDGGAVQ